MSSNQAVAGSRTGSNRSNSNFQKLSSQQNSQQSSQQSSPQNSQQSSPQSSQQNLLPNKYTPSHKFASINKDISEGEFPIYYDRKFNKWIEEYFKFDKYKTKIPKDGSDPCEPNKKKATFSSLPHQTFVRDFLGFKENSPTPYRGLLLFHGLGSGKTCTSIITDNIIQGFKEKNETQKTIVMLPASLKNNFIDELKKCGNKNIRDSSVDQPQFKSYLNSYYQFLSYNANNFIQTTKKDIHTGRTIITNGQIDKIKVTKMPNGFNKSPLYDKNFYDTNNRFNHKTLIIDEVHDFISMIKNGPSWYKLYQEILSASDCKILFLSGTPIQNSIYEVIYIFNMLMGYIFDSNQKGKYIKYSGVRVKLLPENEDEFDRLFFNKDVFQIDKFMPYIIGLVSYYKPDITKGLVAKEEYNDYGIVPMNSYQYTYYNQMKLLEDESEKRKKRTDSMFHRILNDDEETSLYSVYSRQASNFVFPKGIERYLKKDCKQKNRYNLLINRSLQLLFDRIGTSLRGYPIDANETSIIKGIDNIPLSKYSNKMYSIYKKINSSPDAPAFVYSQWKQIEGAEILSYILYSNGMVSIIESDIKIEHLKYLNSNSKCYNCKNTLAEHTFSGDNAQFLNDIKISINLSPKDRKYNGVLKNYIDIVTPWVFNNITDIKNDIPDAKLIAEQMKLSDVSGGFLEPYADKEKQIVDSIKNNKLNISMIWIELFGKYNSEIKMSEHPGWVGGIKETSKDKYICNRNGNNYNLKNLKCPNYSSNQNGGASSSGASQAGASRSRSGASQAGASHSRSGSLSSRSGASQAGASRSRSGASQVSSSHVSSSRSSASHTNGHFEPTYFAVWSGDTKEENTRKILEKANSDSNVYGKNLRVLIATRVANQGISLKNFKQVHCLEPHWNEAKIKQAIGRANRICSHKLLPIDQRKINIFRYYSVRGNNDSNTNYIDKTTITTDLRIKHIADKKQGIINELEKAIKMASIDCHINYKKDTRDTNCFRFDRERMELRDPERQDSILPAYNIRGLFYKEERERNIQRPTFMVRRGDYIYYILILELFDNNREKHICVVYLSDKLYNQTITNSIEEFVILSNKEEEQDKIIDYNNPRIRKQILPIIKNIAKQTITVNIKGRDITIKPSYIHTLNDPSKIKDFRDVQKEILKRDGKNNSEIGQILYDAIKDK